MKGVGSSAHSFHNTSFPPIINVLLSLCSFIFRIGECMFPIGERKFCNAEYTFRGVEYNTSINLNINTMPYKQ